MCEFNTSTMVPQRSLDEFPTELLLKIFSYLDAPDLCRLNQSCKRFNEIINYWEHVILKNITPVVTNQRNPIFSSRCVNNLTALEKCRISQNWRNGRYSEMSLLYTKRKQASWLHLTKQTIWMNRGENIVHYRRDNNNVYVDRPICSMSGQSDSPVEDFQLKDDLLISGQYDGSMWLRSVSDNRIIFDIENCNNSDIMSIDICPSGSYIVSGSGNNYLKIWKFNDYGCQKDRLIQTFSQQLQDSVCRVSILDENSLIAVGTSGSNYRNSLFVYDLQRLSDPIPLPFYRRHSVADLKWDGPHSVWTCGYDSYLKRWDLRSGKCEQIFSDVHSSAMYCLDIDHYNTVMVGNKRNGAVILWDKRMPLSMQVFFMADGSRRDIRDSAVYGLVFDSEFLFASTLQDLKVLKFSG